jgi:hypothetical protein
MHGSIQSRSVPTSAPAAILFFLSLFLFPIHSSRHLLTTRYADDSKSLKFGSSLNNNRTLLSRARLRARILKRARDHPRDRARVQRKSNRRRCRPDAPEAISFKEERAETHSHIYEPRYAKMQTYAAPVIYDALASCAGQLHACDGDRVCNITPLLFSSRHLPPSISIAVCIIACLYDVIL